MRERVLRLFKKTIINFMYSHSWILIDNDMQNITKHKPTFLSSNSTSSACGIDSSSYYKFFTGYFSAYLT